MTRAEGWWPYRSLLILMNFIHLSPSKKSCFFFFFYKSHTLHSVTGGESMWHSTASSHSLCCQSIFLLVLRFLLSEIKAGGLLVLSLTDQQELHSSPPPDPVTSAGGELPHEKSPSQWRSLPLPPLREVPPHSEKSVPMPEDNGAHKQQSSVPTTVLEGGTLPQDYMFQRHG